MEAPAPSGLLLDINSISIVLALVSLVITVIGFFASLAFYRHGIQLSNTANDVLGKVEEKVGSIQTQVGGIFEKTLDAAISGRGQVIENISEVQKQLEEAKANIVRQAIQEIGNVGQRERARLSQIVVDQIENVQRRVELAREVAQEDVTVGTPGKAPSLPQVQSVVLRFMARKNTWVTANEISAATGLLHSYVRRILLELHRQDLINVQPSMFEGHVPASSITETVYSLNERGRALAREARYTP